MIECVAVLSAVAMHTLTMIPSDDCQGALASPPPYHLGLLAGFWIVLTNARRNPAASPACGCSLNHIWRCIPLLNTIRRHQSLLLWIAQHLRVGQPTATWFEADHVEVRTLDRGTRHPSERYATGSTAVDTDLGGVEARRLRIQTPGTTARSRLRTVGRSA